MDLPLTGLRVLDLTWHVAGPFCTRLLADYGADVLKIERPRTGDPARMLPPFYQDEPGLERSGLFLFLNTNKRSVTLDLKSPRGREIVVRLARDADVLVENFSPGVMDRLGIGYKSLSTINPRLVMTSISNFGQTGPYRDWKGTDLTLFAMGGAMLNTGHPEREPLKVAGHVPSFHVGAAAALATAVGRAGACLTGEGDHLDVSFFETWMGAIDRRLSNLMGYQYSGEVSTRQWPASAVGTGFWPCKDGYFFTLIGAARFPTIARMVDAGYLLEQPEWATTAAVSRPERVDEFAAIVIPWMLERTKKEVRAAAQKHGVLGAPVNTVADLFADDHFRFREFFQTIDHPVTGPISYPGYNYRIHGEGSMPGRRHAPLLGEHNEAVLWGELGLTPSDLAALQRDGVV